MPTKRQFDMAIAVVVLVNIALTIPKLWAYRVSADSKENGIKNDVAGAVILS
jgi:hypothetical protein